MLEKLLLAVMVTFSLNVFLGFGLPTTNQTTAKTQQVETPEPKILAQLQQQEQTLRQKMLPRTASSYDVSTAKQVLRLLSNLDKVRLPR